MNTISLQLTISKSLQMYLQQIVKNLQRKFVGSVEIPIMETLTLATPTDVEMIAESDKFSKNMSVMDSFKLEFGVECPNGTVTLDLKKCSLIWKLDYKASLKVLQTATDFEFGELKFNNLTYEMTGAINDLLLFTTDDILELMIEGEHLRWRSKSDIDVMVSRHMNKGLSIHWQQPEDEIQYQNESTPRRYLHPPPSASRTGQMGKTNDDDIQYQNESTPRRRLPTVPVTRETGARNKVTLEGNAPSHTPAATISNNPYSYPPPLQELQSLTRQQGDNYPGPPLGQSPAQMACPKPYDTTHGVSPRGRGGRTPVHSRSCSSLFSTYSNTSNSHKKHLERKDVTRHHYETVRISDEEIQESQRSAYNMTRSRLTSAENLPSQKSGEANPLSSEAPENITPEAHQVLLNVAGVFAENQDSNYEELLEKTIEALSKSKLPRALFKDMKDIERRQSRRIHGKSPDAVEPDSLTPEYLSEARRLGVSVPANEQQDADSVDQAIQDLGEVIRNQPVDVILDETKNGDQSQSQ